MLIRKSGHWEILHYSHRNNSHDYYKCRCVCGAVRNVRESALNNGKSNSCGCKVRINFKDKFEKELLKCSSNVRSCWEWSGDYNSKGYGRMKCSEGSKQAHRFSWEYHNGKKIPDSMLVLHSCDNPICINPSHLSLGTHRKNMEEMVERGRSIRSGLSEDDVRAIKRFLNGKMTVTELAIKYRVNYIVIYNISTGLTWAHVGP